MYKKKLRLGAVLLFQALFLACAKVWPECYLAQKIKKEHKISLGLSPTLHIFCVQSLSKTSAFSELNNTIIQKIADVKAL